VLKIDSKHLYNEVLQRGGGFGRWVGVFFVARGTVLEPFVAVEYVVLKCCEEVLSWLKTFLPSCSLTDLPHAQFCL
jgi:hypothetical protein